tara:strand:- start:56 stop:301 length:246 start_codon:yes stop_codon:yes gene_type:complete
MVYSVDEIHQWRRQAIEKRPKTIIREATPTEKKANEEYLRMHFYRDGQGLLVPRDESQYCPYTGALVGDDGPTKGFEWDSD